MAIHTHPYPLLFASLGGVHLYSFPSPDRDWDLRRGHLLPLRGVPGLGKLGETHELACDDGPSSLI
ncbi:hypothetical protein [Deinococcus marmoris]|uniref:Uncharacterized protein n=1 Tax=Deinococcus marmoris TaxID=249408 RepID=A0A1U7NRZ6_9DEIO|nr:hypothetical protein [Deinococcus marmoris]OLV15690.1 hypothetical protein BOO71_0014110 [Deinococcus marmoris]